MARRPRVGTTGSFPTGQTAICLASLCRALYESNGYTKQLIATADDPFAFLYLYQKAAKKDKAHPPCFSAASIRYLKGLERKYTKPRPAMRAS